MSRCDDGGDVAERDELLKVGNGLIRMWRSTSLSAGSAHGSETMYKYKYNLHIYLTVNFSGKTFTRFLTYYNAPPTALTIHMAILTCKPTLRSVFA